MKKWTALLLAVSLCASLAACGGTGNADQDYVLSLMEKGDYDMAIQVLEHLRDQAGGTAASAETTSSEDLPAETVPDAAGAAETVATTEAAEAPQPIADTNRQQMVIDLVNRFMEEKGNAMVEAYKENIDQNAREISVSHAMEYQLEDWDTFHAHFLLVYLEADVVYDNSVDDKLCLLLDLDSGMVYDSSMVHDNIPDPAVTMEDVCLRAVTAYFSYQTYGLDQMWTERETREELSAAELSAINKALK